MHCCESGVLPIGGGHSAGLYWFAPIGQSCLVAAPSRQQTWMLQPSLPAPLSPSKKQSWLTASLLSPGIPVENESSLSSNGPVHSTSWPSILPSPSSSMQLLHCGPSGSHM